MRYYETMYIVHAALEAGRLKDLIDLVHGLLKDSGCEVLYNELWGKKKLSYIIDKQKYGTYILVQYNGNGSNISSLNMELEHNPNVLAYLTTNIKKGAILKQDKDIEIQIDSNEKISGNRDKKNTLDKKVVDSEKSNNNTDKKNETELKVDNNVNNEEDIKETNTAKEENIETKNKIVVDNVENKEVSESDQKKVEE